MERKMKQLLIICFFISFAVNLKSEENKHKIDSTNIVLVNKALKEVIDEYTSNRYKLLDNYIIGIHLKRVEDTFIIQIGSNIRNVGTLYYMPPSSIIKYDDKVLFVYTGFEEFFDFPEDYKDSLAKTYFPEQYENYKETGYFDLIKDDDEEWLVKIRNDEVVWLQKIVLEPLYWNTKQSLIIRIKE